MEEERKKRRGRRAYLDDFQKTASGEYVYVGKLHYFQEHGMTRRRALVILWALSVGMAAAAVTAGCLPAAGMQNTAYVLLPYVGSLLSAASVIWALCRLSAGGEPLRDYVYRATVAQLKIRCVLTLVFTGAAILGDVVYLILYGAGNKLAGTVGFLACEAVLLACTVVWLVVFSRLDWSK